jgi:hypothetical protein
VCVCVCVCFFVLFFFLECAVHIKSENEGPAKKIDGPPRAFAKSQTHSRTHLPALVFLARFSVRGVQKYYTNILRYGRMRNARVPQLLRVPLHVRCNWRADRSLISSKSCQPTVAGALVTALLREGGAVVSASDSSDSGQWPVVPDLLGAGLLDSQLLGHRTSGIGVGVSVSISSSTTHHRMSPPPRVSAEC